jgi:hypothetical protein
MPSVQSKPHIDGCNDYKMRIEYLLNPAKSPMPYEFVYDQPFTCKKEKTIVADIEKVCSSTPLCNGM